MQTMIKVSDFSDTDYQIGVKDAIDLWTGLDLATIPAPTFKHRLCFDLESSPEILTLKLLNSIYSCDEEGFLKIEDEILGYLTFNKNTKEVDYDSLCDALCYPLPCNNIENKSYLFQFVSYILKQKSPFAYDSLKGLKMFSGTMFLVDTPQSQCTKQITINLLQLFIYHANEMEQIIKIAPSIVKNSLFNESWKKIIETHKSAIPTKHLAWVSKMGIDNEIIPLMKAISEREDGNNVSFLVKFVEAMQKNTMLQHYKSRNSGGRIYTTILDIYNSDPAYKIKQLLEYLIRQNFFYGDFSCPIKQSNFLKDYLMIAQQNNLQYNRFPNDVEKAHNNMSNNCKNLNVPDTIVDQFSQSVEKLKNLEQTIGKYCIVIPTTPKDVVNEGNALNHCVGNYVKRIATGQTQIGFLRLTESPTESFVTLEIKDGLVVEAKQKFNDDVDSELWTIIHKFEKKWKEGNKVC